jgi:hypothetical protein
MKIVRQILFILFTGVFLFGVFPGMLSCETENCVSVAENDLLVSFYEQDSTTLKNVMFEYVKAAGSDTIFYDHNTGRSDFRFPLNPADDQTLFIMQIIDSVSYDTISREPVVIDTTYYLRDGIDSLWIDYQRSQRIITEACGVEINYTHLSVEKSTFQSYEFEDEKTFLSRLNNVNIKIYD